MVVLQICFGGRHEGSQQPTRHKRDGDISFSFRLPSQSDDLDVSSLERVQLSHLHLSVVILFL